MQTGAGAIVGSYGSDDAKTRAKLHAESEINKLHGMLPTRATLCQSNNPSHLQATLLSNLDLRMYIYHICSQYLKRSVIYVMDIGRIDKHLPREPFNYSAIRYDDARREKRTRFLDFVSIRNGGR